MSSSSSSLFVHHVCLLLVLTILSNMCVNTLPQDYRHCQSDSDCSPSQCCAPTPNGRNVCLNFEGIGQQCYFLQRTPVCHLLCSCWTLVRISHIVYLQSCGCSPGLRCVSTTPYSSGILGDSYVCAKHRPHRRYKFAPNHDNHENELSRFLWFKHYSQI